MACLLMLGCTSSGTKFDFSQAAGFVRGQTTEAQVRASLGTPNGLSMLPDGTRVLVYSYLYAGVRPETFIPLVGLFVAGAEMQVQTATFTFGPDGLLQSSSGYQGAAGTGRAGAW